MICEVAEVNILTDKTKYMMMPMLISGPQQPGININVYLRPLIDDMKNCGPRVFRSMMRSRRNRSHCMA
jgi:hypothetical protein